MHCVLHPHALVQHGNPLFTGVFYSPVGEDEEVEVRLSCQCLIQRACVVPCEPHAGVVRYLCYSELLLFRLLMPTWQRAGDWYVLLNAMQVLV
jgi:hypothetical protein